MARETCYRCFWPKPLCWCSSIVPMTTRTRFVFLMHPKEFKQEKAATGRLTHLCLPDERDSHGHRFRRRRICPVADSFPRQFSRAPLSRRVRPGSLARRPHRHRTRSAPARRLPSRCHVGLRAQDAQAKPFAPTSAPRQVHRLRPQPLRDQTTTAGRLLSTLEAVHELLLALERSGLDRYPLPTQLPGLFDRMQDFQIKCASDPARGGYRRSAYSAPGERAAPHGRSGARRTRFLK